MSLHEMEHWHAETEVPQEICTTNAKQKEKQHFKMSFLYAQQHRATTPQPLAWLRKGASTFVATNIWSRGRPFRARPSTVSERRFP